MVLHQVHAIGLEALERFVDLAGGGLAGAPVELSHEENLLAVAVAQGFAHPDFALAIVIVPAVVQEVDALVHGGADDFDGVLLVGGDAHVIAAESDGGDAFSGAAEGAIDHAAGPGLRGGGKGGCQRCADDRAEDFAAGKMRIVHGRNLSISRGAMLARATRRGA